MTESKDYLSSVELDSRLWQPPLDRHVLKKLDSLYILQQKVDSVRSVEDGLEAYNEWMRDLVENLVL